MSKSDSSKKRITDTGELPRRLLPVPPLSFWSAQGTEPVAEHTLRATQVIWFSACVEQARLFDAVDRLVALFHAGQLPVRKGSASALLYEYWQQRDERLSADERRHLYARVFGIGGAQTGGVAPNRALPAHWLAFVEAVHRADGPGAHDLLDSPGVAPTARALAVNVTRHGAGTARAAASLHEHLQQALALLSDPDVRTAYGARDSWQLVDRIATRYLGASRPVGRYRVLANAGSTILGWLARNAGRMNASSHAAPDLRPYPTDAELRSAIEVWLSVTVGDGDGDA